MHAKDGQYAPTLFREMSNGSVLVELFPTRKIPGLSMLTTPQETLEASRFAQCCAMATVSNRPRFAAFSEFRNQILQNC
jgi:hypothetical protein